MRAKPFVIGFVIWLAVSLFFTGSVMARYYGSHKPFGFEFYATGLHYGLWALLAPFIAFVCDRWPLAEGGRLRRDLTLRILWLVLIALAITPMVSWSYLAIMYHTYFPFKQYAPTFSALLNNDLWNSMHDDFMTGIVLLVAFQGWRVWRDLQTEQRRSGELEKQLAVARLDALRMQLHPHFLFNTFHTITGLIGEDPPTARRMVVALGDLLRRTLQEPSAPMQSLARELELIDLYMGIQRLRLGDRVSLDYHIDPEVTTAEVPHLLLQPLFENAVRHGAARIAGPCAITFRARRNNEGRRVHLSLENDAPPAPSARPKSPTASKNAKAGYGVGLTNTLGRLELHYGDDYTFEYIDRPQGGVRIELSLPYRHAGEERRDVHAPAPAGVAD
jgi:two-component system LytT family sensor kinase